MRAVGYPKTTSTTPTVTQCQTLLVPNSSPLSDQRERRGMSPTCNAATGRERAFSGLWTEGPVPAAPPMSASGAERPCGRHC